MLAVPAQVAQLTLQASQVLRSVRYWVAVHLVHVVVVFSQSTQFGLQSLTHFEVATSRSKPAWHDVQVVASPLHSKHEASHLPQVAFASKYQDWLQAVQFSGLVSQERQFSEQLTQALMFVTVSGFRNSWGESQLVQLTDTWLHDKQLSSQIEQTFDAFMFKK